MLQLFVQPIYKNPCVFYIFTTFSMKNYSWFISSFRLVFLWPARNLQLPPRLACVATLFFTANFFFDQLQGASPVHRDDTISSARIISSNVQTPYDSPLLLIGIMYGWGIETTEGLFWIICGAKIDLEEEWRLHELRFGKSDRYEMNRNEFCRWLAAGLVAQPEMGNWLHCRHPRLQWTTKGMLSWKLRQRPSVI